MFTKTVLAGIRPAGVLLALGLAFSFCLTPRDAGASGQTVTIPDLEHRVAIMQDRDGIMHIYAQDPQGLFLAQGWIHARDRLFQMDVLRRRASGTLAELVGPAALASDVQFRTIGLRRAAVKSEPILSQETQAAFDAYASGVNAYIASLETPADLPVEYGALNVIEVAPWESVDSLTIAKLLSFSLSFDLDIAPTLALQAYVHALGQDGVALYFEDTHRSAPFDGPATVPDALGGAPAPLGQAALGQAALGQVALGQVALGQAALGQAAMAGALTDEAKQKTPPGLRDDVIALATRYKKRVEHLPLFQNALDPSKHDRGSNAWVVAGNLTDSGRPFLASDQHLALGNPATFYPIHLVSESEGYDVIGASLPGTPFVLVGQNADLAWGTTNFRIDVTDTYAEQLVLDYASPSGLSSVYLGYPEHVLPLPQTYRYNGFGGNLVTAPPNTVVNGVFIPQAVLIIPRRNQGPILELNPETGTALSVQYTGFSGTREADAFRQLNLSRSLEDVTAALQSFDVGAQHFMVADRKGNIAYFANAEMPLREDLQNMAVEGLPPYFIRNGQGSNEWLPVADPQPGQSIPYEILPFEEMPQVVNPPSGIISNGNNTPFGTTLDNDPLNQVRPGGGILYFAPVFSFGTRAEIIRRELAGRSATGLLTPQDMTDIQANVVLRDSEVFTPYILQAHGNAFRSAAAELAALAEDPVIAEAVNRLAAWDHSAPTGIFEGFDASDVDGTLSDPSEAEIANSIAATIYAVWRGRIVVNTIDKTLEAHALPSPGDEQSMTALRNLLDNFDSNRGFGLSGVNFFDVPGIDNPADRRDYVILASLAETLEMLAGPDFFETPDQDAYRWGNLHQLVLEHPLGGAFDLRPGPGVGFPLDGGFGTVDAATHVLRVDSSDDFDFPEGPTRRYLAEVGAGKGAILADSSLPGGTSGVPGDPFQINLLARWLTNDTYALRQSRREISRDLARIILLSP